MNKDEILVPVLQAINDLRAEVRDNKREIREMREENNKRWEENDKRWKENDKQWKENWRMWEENKKLWAEYRENRKLDKKELFDTLLKYDISISTQLCDKNAEKMKRLLKIK